MTEPFDGLAMLTEPDLRVRVIRKRNLIETARKEAHERKIQKLMERDDVYVSGWLWWKVYRKRTREEAEEYYSAENSLSFEEALDTDDYNRWIYGSLRKKTDDFFNNQLKRLRRIERMTEDSREAYLTTEALAWLNDD